MNSFSSKPTTKETIEWIKMFKLIPIISYSSICRHISPQTGIVEICTVVWI